MIRLILILILTLFAVPVFNVKAKYSNENNTKKVKLIYVYDALCGWCYGFSPVMMQLHSKYKDSIDFQVVSGGMITGNRIGPIGAEMVGSNFC